MLMKCFMPGLVLFLMLTGFTDSFAGGISADAGLTPAQDKWIIRTQVRYLNRSNDPSPMGRKMEMFMFPLIVAYGLRPDFTIMVRQPFASMEMTMRGETTQNSGFGDLLIMAKYRAFRHNSRQYTIGIAPLLAVEIPTGKAPFTSDATNLKTGLYISGRKAPWASDLNVSFTWKGIAGGDDRARKEIIDIVGALAYQIDLGNESRTALAPVIELSYTNTTADRISGEKQANSGESLIRLSPGLKYTHSSIIFESLLQIPVWQNQIGSQPELRLGVLFGIRVFL